MYFFNSNSCNNQTSYPQQKSQSYSSRINKDRNTVLFNKVLSTASPEVKEVFYKRNEQTKKD